MTSALLLGATKGLGFELAVEASRRGIVPIICGRSVDDLADSPGLPANAKLRMLDFESETSVQAFALEEEPHDYVFWVAGAFLKKAHAALTDAEIDGMIDLHLRGPMKLMRRYLSRTRNSFHLTVIASCSAWRRREQEGLYTAVKAAQAAFARNLTPELVADRPGSKVTLINPGGLRVPTFNRELMDGERFLDPARVAALIWDAMLGQTCAFLELQILRPSNAGANPTPVIVTGPVAPEMPL